MRTNQNLFRILKNYALPLTFIAAAGLSNAIGQNPQVMLLALSKTDHMLALVDPTNLKVLARVPVGSDPHEVIASSDGKTAYVSITGGGRSHEIDAIDLVSRKALPMVNTTPLIGPHGITFVGGKVWFSAEGAKSVGRYDPSSGQLDWSMGTGQDRTHMIFVTQDEKHIYTTNVDAGSVSVLLDTVIAPGANPMGFVPPPRKEWIQTVIPTSKGVEGFDVTPDGKQLWAASAGDGTIWIIDLVHKKVSSKINAGVVGANRLVFTPDGQKALVSSLRAGEILVFDVASQKEIKRINIGHGAAGLLVEANGSRAFAGCTPDNYIAVIDLKTLEVTGHIDVGGGPDGLAWAVQR
jgi:DNA-binding beta-propeller fold protein YncE